MKGFFLLSNGEIVEQEGGPTGNIEDWKSIPKIIDGCKVFAASITRDGINAIRTAIFADEESLLGMSRAKDGLTPVEDGYLKERGYCPA